MTKIPSIDHSILSPNGRVSKRSREAAMERVRKELFADIEDPQIFKPPTNAEKALSLRRTAENLRQLAARGMKPKAYVKAAAKLETEADVLDNIRGENGANGGKVK